MKLLSRINNIQKMPTECNLLWSLIGLDTRYVENRNQHRPGDDFDIEDQDLATCGVILGLVVSHQPASMLPNWAIPDIGKASA